MNRATLANWADGDDRSRSDEAIGKTSVQGTSGADELIVEANGLRLREAPSTNSPVLVELQRGSILTVIGAAAKGWKHVLTTEKLIEIEGYVAEEFVEPEQLKPAGFFRRLLPLKLTSADLKKLAKRANDDFVDDIVDAINRHAPEFGVFKSRKRFAHFIAQMAHESAGFRAMVENGDPDPQKYFSQYENKKILGNTEPGDGFRFRGRGIIQLTGRDNYTRYGKMLGLDLVSDPDLAAAPEEAVRIALQYWRVLKLNTYADKNDIRELTRRINTALNGLDDRIRYFVSARSIWGGPPPRTKPKKKDGSTAAIGTAGAGGAVVAGSAAVDVYEAEGDPQKTVDATAEAQQALASPSTPEAVPAEPAPIDQTPSDVAPEESVQTDQLAPDPLESVEEFARDFGEKLVDPQNTLETGLVVLGIIIALLALYVLFRRRWD